MRARQCPALCVLPLATVFALCAGDVTPQQLRERGLTALKAAQADEGRIVEAARFLSLAADAYAAAGSDDQAQELEAYLYWAKKKMTLQQMDAFLTGGEPEKKVLARLEAVVAAKPEASEAKAKLQKAEAFLTANPTEPLLCAIRFFEVADRFAGTSESLEAQRKSLELMQKVKAEPQPVAAKQVAPQPKILSVVGRYVHTQGPIGAPVVNGITVLNGNGRFDGPKQLGGGRWTYDSGTDTIKLMFDGWPNPKDYNYCKGDGKGKYRYVFDCGWELILERIVSDAPKGQR